MKKFVLPLIFACLAECSEFASLRPIVMDIIGNNVNWGVSGIVGDTDLNDSQDTVKKKFGSPSSDFSNIDLINKHNISALYEKSIQRLDRYEKCLEYTQYNDSIHLIEAANKNFQVCVKSLVNFTKLKEEISEAKPKGELDMVFSKFCKMSPDLNYCVLNFTSTIDLCLDEGEKDTIKILQSITGALLSFQCHNEGDRLSLFYSEGGPECLMNKTEAIRRCVNTSFGKVRHFLPEKPSLPDLLSAFKFEEDQCKSMSELQVCVVAELSKCEEPTPANIVESLFEFVRQSTPCSGANRKNV